MNEIVKRNETVAVQNSSRGMALMPQNFTEIVDFSRAMAKAGTAIPKHLRDNAGACMAVAMQALEWGMSPFAVANKSYSVSDRIAYEAQLIAAVVNTRSGLQGRLKYDFAGDGQNLVCTVVGIIDGEEYSYQSPRLGDIRPQNSPLWKTDPRQQIGYYSARSWARRFVPEVILGVYDRDELQLDSHEVNLTPPPAPKIDHDEPTPNETLSPPPAPKFEDAEVIKDECPSDFLKRLDDAMTLCSSAEAMEEIWNEFDPLATHSDDEHTQDICVKIKERHLKRVNNPFD